MNRVAAKILGPSRLPKDLVPDILADYVRVNPYSIDTVAFCPEMISPVRLSPKLTELFENLDRCLSFHSSHQIRYCHFRGNHHDQMDV